MSLRDDYKIIVVGSGFYGCVMAEEIANVLNFPVLVVDKRSHLGGNCYSYNDPVTDIEIHQYGSHIFHTSNQVVWDYINQFSSFNHYRHKVLSVYKNENYPIPINLDTINKFFKQELNAIEAKEFIRQLCQEENGELNFEKKALATIGPQLYAAFVKGYTAKQWNTDPTMLPSSIFSRVPIRYDHNDFYFSDQFEGIPVDGYSRIFEKMMDHPLIQVKLNTDFHELRPSLSKNIFIIYSGPIDRYFDYQFGALGWRTLHFEKEYKDVNFFQKNSVLNYPEEKVPYTRTHEFKYYHPGRWDHQNKTLIFREYSELATKKHDPYYPIGTRQDLEKLTKYKELARKDRNLHFGGRLGEYLYLDMHQVIAQALNHFKQIKQKLILKMTEN